MRKLACSLVLVAGIALPGSGYAIGPWGPECGCRATPSGVEFVNQPILQGVKCVSPVVQVNGFGQEVIPGRISDAFELVLRKASISLVEWGENKNNGVECPLLNVRVSAIESDGCISFTSTCEFSEMVAVPRRQRQCYLMAITWNRGVAYGVQNHPDGNALVLEEVRACAEAFANDYLAANPPKEPVKVRDDPAERAFTLEELGKWQEAARAKSKAD